MEPSPPPETTGGPPPPLPDHRPPKVAATGCLRALSLGCGAFIVLALVVLAVAFWNFDKIAVRIQEKFVLDSLRRAEVPPAVIEDAKAILEEYARAAKAADMGMGAWKDALEAFARTPAALVLAILDARAGARATPGVTPEDRERAERVFERLLRGAAEEKIHAEDLEELVRRARHAGGGARAVDVGEVARRELQGFLLEAEKLAEEKGLPAGPYTPDIPALLRQGLWSSLKAKR